MRRVSRLFSESLMMLALCACTNTAAVKEVEPNWDGIKKQAAIEEDGLLRGTTEAEREIIREVLTECASNTGARLFLDNDRRVIVIAVEYLTAENMNPCLQSADGKIVIIDKRPTNEYELGIKELDIVHRSNNTSKIHELVEKLRAGKGIGEGELAYINEDLGAVYLGVRVIPFECWQSLDMHGEYQTIPWAALSVEIKQTILELQELGVPVTLQRSFVDPHWLDFEGRATPAVGC